MKAAVKIIEVSAGLYLLFNAILKAKQRPRFKKDTYPSFSPMNKLQSLVPATFPLKANFK